MSLFSTWQRYFCKEFLKTFFLFLLCFYGLYALIDYAGHTSSLQSHHSKFRFYEIMRYYVNDFSRRSDVIIAFGLLISTIRTVYLFNTRKELVALMAGGIALRKLVTPFVFLGLCFTILVFVNEEWVQPTAFSHIKKIEDRHTRERSRQKRKNNAANAIQHLNLYDGTLLLYREYFPESATFDDVYWVKSGAEIYRMKELVYQSGNSFGKDVDTLKRSPKGFFYSSGFSQKEPFTTLVIDTDHLADSIILSEHLPPSELYQKLNQIESIKSEKDAQIASSFYKKLALPLLPLIATLLPLSACLVFSRTLSGFKIYGTCLFALTALYLVTDAVEVLAKRQVIPPYVVLIPSLISLFYGTARWLAIR